MAGEGDEIKGRVKQATGELVDDPNMKREGEVDEATGKVKDAADKVKDAADKVADKIKDVVNKK